MINLLIFNLLILKSTYAQQEVWAKITAGATRQRIRLAVPNFMIPSNSPDGIISSSKEIRQITIDDLEFSLYFEIVKIDTLKPFSIVEKKVDFTGWQNTGAQVLFVGDVQIKKKTTLNIRLYDLFTRKVIGTKTYEISDNIRWLSHKIADDVIKLLTGEDGVSQTKIAFSLRKGTAKELAVVDYDGYSLDQLTNSGELKLYPDWMPTANKIAFCSYAKNNFNIYTYDLNKKAIDLICSKDGLNTNPAYSPDGKLIAVSLSYESSPDIFIMNADGNNIRRITYGNSLDISPTWSPSGQELAFVSDRTGVPQIYVINIDGTNQRRLTFQGSYNTSPAWSPRGDLIAYVSRISDGSNQIYVTDLTGENRVCLTNLRNSEEPSFSPDGLHITFSSNRSGTYELYTMHWNGAGQRRITNTNGAFSPTWSMRLTR
jgi:TolB protein